MKNEKPQNPSAFPITATEQSFFNQSPLMPETGMTLRDYFAAKAMQGFIIKYGDTDFTQMVILSYEVADTMLKQREK